MAITVFPDVLFASLDEQNPFVPDLDMYNRFCVCRDVGRRDGDADEAVIVFDQLQGDIDVGTFLPQKMFAGDSQQPSMRIADALNGYAGEIAEISVEILEDGPSAGNASLWVIDSIGTITSVPLVPGVSGK